MVALGLSGVPAAAQEPASRPLDELRLSELGYQDVTLRGRLVSTDYFVPGPGDFALDDDNWIDLSYQPTDLIGPDSVLSVVWNGVPMQDVALAEPGATTISVRLPRERVEADVNRLQVQAALQLAIAGDCDDESPARHLTIFSSSRIRYSYVDREPHPRPVTPDLARYPAPFFLPNNPQPAPVRLVTPGQPTSAELSAALRVAAQLGQFAGSHGLPLELVADTPQAVADFATAHLVFVGRQTELPSLALLPNPSSQVVRAADDTYQDGSGQPVPNGTGVVFEVASPWNPARAALVVTGADDAAVEQAATAVGGRAGVGALRGDAALVSDAQPAPSVEPATPTPTSLADLGRADDLVTGVGEHAVSFSIDAAGLASRGALPFELVTSHSPLLDPVRSSFRLVVNGVPLSATSFRDVAPTRGLTRIDMPVAALRPGLNTLRVEFALALPRPADASSVCARLPVEQAWAVLHADSALEPPAGPPAEPVTLASYPYSFVRGGRLDETVFIVPDSLGDGTALARLVADLGRSTRGDVIQVHAVRADEFSLDPAQAAGADVVVWGLPEANPVVGELDGRLPIQLDASGRRFVFSQELTLTVRDASKLGIIQEIPSPWSSGRGVLVVTATSPDELKLAVEALRQGGLSGNAALVSQAESVAVESAPTTGSARPALQVSTFRLRPSTPSASPAGGGRPPYVLLASAAVAAMAVLIAVALGLQALAARRDQG